MKEIEKKHVVLSMGNGAVLEGFVESMDDKFLNLVETNNQKVIVKIDDISFARLGQAEVIPYQEPQKPKFTQEDYSVPLNEVQSPYVPQLEFTRKTK